MRTAWGSCRWTQMSFLISWPHKGLFISPTPWIFIVQAIGLIPLEGPNCEFKGLMTRAYEWPPASALRVTHWLLLSCFYPDGVTAGLSGYCRPSGCIVSFRPICISAIRGDFLSSLSTGCRGHRRNRGGAFGRSTYSTCPAQGRQVDCTVQGWQSRREEPSIAWVLLRVSQWSHPLGYCLQQFILSWYQDHISFLYFNIGNRKGKKKYKNQLKYSFVVQLLSYFWLFVTSWTTTHQGSLSFTISQSLLSFMSIESVMPFLPHAFTLLE